MPVRLLMDGPSGGLLRVRGDGVAFHVLRDASGLHLLDAGFVNGRARLKEALRVVGWDGLPLMGIVLTHGHLDHILNVAPLVEETGAWVAAPRFDQTHYEGKPVYSGWARATGALEAVGRSRFGFRPFTPDRLLDDGDRIDIWHGLRVVHLPGHTKGHSGFFCEKLGLLFTGDLFASWKPFSFFPPIIFNQDEGVLRKSVGKALSIEVKGLIPNHGDDAEPWVHLARLRKIAEPYR